MKLKSCLLLSTLALGSVSVGAQTNVDINLNMEHSVDGESRFGRERRMTIHSSLTESDWDGHEDMLDYLINDLDVYFGRETGGATWKMHYVEEDPNKPGWANEAQMKTHGQGLKEWYASDDYASRRQYEGKSNMIMGTNSHTPMYPHLSYYDGFGRGSGGWFVKDTDAAADWVAKYMANYFAQSDDDIGEELPVYWECSNEPDMDMLNAQFGMIVSSLEKNWEYHKLVAQEVRAKLGDKAPQIGGMCLGQLDLFKPDGIPTRVPGTYWDQYSSTEAISWYTNMLKGVGEEGGVPNPGVGLDEWPKAWDNRTKNWWQWDYMYQGFIDYCGEDMDFYSVHMYDWPQEQAQNDKANTRSGGHVEAMLDMFEWYDNHMEFEGGKKPIVMSEFGTVNTQLIDGMDGDRDWLFIKPFNQMMMQFLERPSHVVYSMPFAPTKAVWGADFNGATGPNVPVSRYDGATLMEPVGTWTGNGTTWVFNEPSGGWKWSGIIHFFELWKDVEGTRIDTKSDDNDVQVDAYVDGKKVYLILNNCIDTDKTLNLNTFGIAGNTLDNVELRHIFRGDDDLTKYTVANMTSAPAQVSLKPNSTIVLAYTYASDVTINEESKETKYMSAPLAGDAKNDRGTQLCHSTASASLTTTVSNVVKPTNGEAIIRIGGFFPNPSDGVLANGQTGMKIKALKVNGNDVIVEGDGFVANTRGYGLGNYGGAWLGVVELECPVEYLKDGDNTVYFERWQPAEYTTCMIQAFDMTTAPGRAGAGSTLTAISLGAGAESLMEGNTLGLAAVFTPEDASNKGLTWSSSDSNVATVDENGVVTAVANTGSATITATSTANASIKATKTINAIPYEASAVTGISIIEGASITVERFVNTPLTIEFTPIAVTAPEIEWSSSDETIVEVVNGKVVGKVLGESAVITAKVKGTSITDEITVEVTLAGGEDVFTRNLPDYIFPVTSFDVTIPANVLGARTVVIELLKGGNVVGTGQASVDAEGSASAEITVTLDAAPAIGTGYEFKVTLKDGATVLSTKTKVTEVKATVLPTEVLLDKAKITVFKDDSRTLTATVMPTDAADKTVTWSSSDNSIATVSTTGEVSGIEAGTVTITATSNTGSKAQSCEVTVVALDPNAAVIIVEAEDFKETSGTTDDSGWGGPGLGVNKTTTGVNYVNGDDYFLVDFTVTTAGTYFPTAITSTPENGRDISITIGDETLTLGLPSSGDWDATTSTVIPGNFTLTAGTHTMRVEAVTQYDWQFNTDKVILTQGEGVEADVDGEGPTVDNDENEFAFSIYPNPATDNITVDGITEGASVTVINMQGSVIEQVQATGTSIELSVNNYTNGIYFIYVTVDGTNTIQKFIKN